MRRPVHLLVLPALLVPLLAAGTAAAEGAASDEFEGSLAAPWTIRNGTPDDPILAFQPGQLTILAWEGDIVGTATDAQSLYLQPAPAGDFRVTTLVHFVAAKPQLRAGLVLHASDDDFFLVALGHENGTRVVETIAEQGGVPTRETFPIPETDLWLRYEVVDGTLAAFASYDGVLWKPAGFGLLPAGFDLLPPGTVQVGLLATGGHPATPYESAEPAGFDFFRVEAPPAGPSRTDAPELTLAITPAEGEAPLEVTVTGTLSYDYPGLGWYFRPGDGSPDVEGTGFPVTFNHTYATSGNYSALFGARTARENLGSEAARVTVTARPEETPEQPAPPPEPEPLEPASTDATDEPAAEVEAKKEQEPAPDEALPEDEPVEVAADPVAIAVASAEGTGDALRGPSTVTVLNVDDPSRTRLVLVAPDGSERTLASGTATAGWDTTDAENGYYRVEARERRDDGSEVTLASSRVLVVNPRASPAEAAAAVATGVLVGAAASSLSSVVGGALGGRGFDVLGFFQEAATDVGQDRLRDRTKDVAALDRRIRVRSLAAAGITVVLIGIFFTFTAFDGWNFAGYFRLLPVFGGAALAFGVAKYGAEFLLARYTGAKGRFRLWAPGAISLAVTSIVFRSPFGYPGYVDEDEIGDDAARAQRRVAGVRALAFLGLSAAFALPFLVAGEVWRFDFAEAGLTLALTAFATSALPFRPLPGSDVWAWSKLAWVAPAVVGIGLYFLFQLGILPGWGVVAVGVAGGLAAAVAVWRLRGAAALLARSSS